MRIIQVQYTVSPAFADRNRQNISRVMDELRALNPTGFRYSAFLKSDGKTFVHLVLSTDETEHLPSSLASFQEFQKELRASGLEVPPEFSDMSLVDSFPG